MRRSARSRARSERRELESEKRTKLLEKEIERLAELESRLDALLLSRSDRRPQGDGPLEQL
ncbi:hypothetical protein VB734_13450 [Synechococcus sp. BA-124 BA4]|uniref:hypothetical protein n=1 Tax=Synechococcus sp. CBW1107 TaxID=2789857 RepID=UPI002AD35ED4|nr:hypothetical protein [Synechococcus sp. CBW1107]MEA5401046.1 hypothetical protein [Synechococcus sp. BA-124 BA4]CAK6697873.1 hypothetical protein BBFGKLBO_02341 [Synechococcus sp. CBW1107]